MNTLKYIFTNTLKKENFTAFGDERGCDVYILGTLHYASFNPIFHYSFKHILNVIYNLQPQKVLIEARKEVYEVADIVDGPPEMILCYSYCKEKGIPVGFIDWFDESSEADTTSAERDDKIYDNIRNELSGLSENNRPVLVVCGTVHREESGKRFISDGFKQKQINNKISFFRSGNKFMYPERYLSDLEQAIFHHKSSDDIKWQNVARSLQRILDKGVLKNREYIFKFK